MFKKKLSTRDMVKSKSFPNDENGTACHVKTDKREKKQPKKKKKKVEKNANSKQTRSRAFLGIVAIVVGLGISLVGIPLLRAQTTQLIPVYIFTEFVHQGTQITDNMLEEVERSSYQLPNDLVTDKREIVGGFLTADSIKGDIATMGRVSAHYPGDNPELADLPDGKLAVSITLSSLSQSVASMLRAGDIIQVFTVEKEGTEELTLSPASLQYIEVLAVFDNSGLEVSAANANLVNTITVIASRAQAEELVLLEHTGILHAALAIRGDDDAKATALALQDAYWTEEPEKIPEDGQEVMN